LALQTLKHYINGRWETGATLGTRENPSDLSEVVTQFARADAAQAASAARAAADAREPWAQSSPQRRFEVLDAIGAELLARKEELGRLLARELGTVLREAVAEAAHAGQVFKRFAAEALRLRGEKPACASGGVDAELLREPVGVVAAITPAVRPLAIPAARIAPALACGNTVVFKPSELAPATAWTLSEIISRAGLPAGAFNLVMGGGRVGQTLVESPLVDAIAFTGSASVAQALTKSAGARGAKLQVDRGGENVLVVLDDADLALAVTCAVESAFAAAGQGCTACHRIIVTAGLHDRFVHALRQRTRALAVGPALQHGIDIGPLATRERLDHVLAQLQSGRTEGAEWLAGGETLQRETRGHYLSPALFVAQPQHRIAGGEVFGPLACVLRADSEEQALALVDGMSCGLIASVCTSSLKRAASFKRRVRSAFALVNLPTVHADLQAPLLARRAIEFNTVVKTTCTQA
jgi:aldehyde dehydrogenase (NAD+)